MAGISRVSSPWRTCCDISPEIMQLSGRNFPNWWVNFKYFGNRKEAYTRDPAEKLVEAYYTCDILCVYFIIIKYYSNIMSTLRNIIYRPTYISVNMYICTYECVVSMSIAPAWLMLVTIIRIGLVW